MTLLEFRRLRDLKQLQLVRRRGVKLAERTDQNSRYVLYQLDAFYVEFVYSHDATLKGMDVFGGTALLEPYLDDIRISLPF